MERAYLLIAGVLTGAAVGLLSSSFGSWLAAGTVMGVTLSLFAQPRRKDPGQSQLKVDS